MSSVTKQRPASWQRWVAPAALAFCAAMADFDAEAEVVSIPPVPTYAAMPFPAQSGFLRDKDGAVLWPAGTDTYCRADPAQPCIDWGLAWYRWNPATGEHSRNNLGVAAGSYYPRVVAGRNVWMHTTPMSEPTARQTWRVLLKTPDALIEQEFPADSYRHIEELVPLGEDSVFAMQRDETTRHPRGLLLQRVGGRIELHPMPELPEVLRDDYAVVALDEQRIMLIGGGAGKYRGCVEECLASTHVLDLKARRWTPGPSMIEGRAEAVTARLPDGSVLVAGGYTKAEPWGPGPSRTAELWSPISNRFEPLPPMPVPTARAKAYWAPGQEGRTLLIAEGMSAGISAFDVQRRVWYLAGAWEAGSEEGACTFVPFKMGEQTWAWQNFKSEGHYSC